APKAVYSDKEFTEEEMPGFGISILTAVLPIIFIFIKTIADFVLPKSSLLTFTDFIGEPGAALMITFVVSIYTLGIRKGKSIKDVMNTFANAVSGIAMILLIIAGGG